jgi:hypothetical protein
MEADKTQDHDWRWSCHSDDHSEFANLSEFLAELRKGGQYVERGIVRAVECRRPSSMRPVLLVSVVGTASIGADICRVECICGTLCGIEGNDRRVMTQMRKQLKSLKGDCVSMGFDVRSSLLDENA